MLYRSATHLKTDHSTRLFTISIMPLSEPQRTEIKEQHTSWDCEVSIDGTVTKVDLRYGYPRIKNDPVNGLRFSCPTDRGWVRTTDDTGKGKDREVTISPLSEYAQDKQRSYALPSGSGLSLGGNGEYSSASIFTIAFFSGEKELYYYISAVGERPSRV